MRSDAERRATALSLIRPEPEAQPASSDLTAPDLAARQIREAQERSTMDLSGTPRFAWRSLDRLVGPLLPGYLITVGALQGNGKSAFLMSHMDACARAQLPTLYVPLEVDAHECRTQWACWVRGVSYLLYKRQEWGLLPEGTRETIDETLAEQAVNPYVHFAPERRITLVGLERRIEWAMAEAGVKQVILDHVHRMDHGEQDNIRINVGEAARRLRDLSRANDLVTLAAVQLNRSPDVFDPYRPPLASRVRESSGLQDEPNLTLMLSRCLDPMAPKADKKAVRDGQMEEWRVALPDAMDVTVRKHRDDGSVLSRKVRLRVVNGRVEDTYEQLGPDEP